MHNGLNESEQTLGDSEGQGNLACCSPWGCKELDTNEELNNIKISIFYRNYFTQYSKVIYDNPPANTVLKCDRSKAFPLGSETIRMPLLPLLFSIVLES